MSYKIVSKYTNELNDNDWVSLIKSYNRSFIKKFSINFLKKKYSSSVFGYSCHGILYYEFEIVGLFSIIPHEYIIKGQKEIIGLSCDAFIDFKHRNDEFHLKNISISAMNKILEKNVSKFISLPNPNAYKYWRFLSNWKDIGDLNYYVYPITPFGKKFKYFNKITKNLFLFISHIFRIFYSNSRRNSKRHFFLNINDLFIKNRFHNKYYKTIYISKNVWGVYRIYLEKNHKVAYLVFINDLSKKYVSLMINKILINNNNIDLIIYVGNLENKPFHFIKIPKKSEPRRMGFIGLDLNNNDNNFFNLEKWNVSLVNFDNR